MRITIIVWLILMSTGATVYTAKAAKTIDDGRQTWVLDKQGEWKDLATLEDGDYLLAVARIKQSVAEGNKSSIVKELNQVKTDYPELAGADLDSYMKGEILFAEGKWSKASMQYDQFLESYADSWLFSAALERQFSIATAFLGGQKRTALKIFKLAAYEEGEKIMEKIADRAGDAPIAKRALIAVANSYEKREKYLDAYEAWAEVSNRWPTGETGKLAMLKMAETLHSAYKGPRYDPSSLKSAQSYYKDFEDRHPELSQEYKIGENIAMIDEQAAYKQFQIAEYYHRTDSLQAANIYYNSVIENWPDSNAAKMAEEKIRQNNSPEGQEPAPRDFKRKLFDTGNDLLDNWFNVFKKKEPLN
ncbi:MAG: outer membrane protein assembly factor BamD [Sedimentisphaerales bacterium]|nr:outer membrane protein assembly factor BamD [Sedimentisphaerales bacterium]